MLGHFGFSYIGLLYMLMLQVPNLMWARRKPAGYDPSGENKVLLVFERAGHIGIHLQHIKEVRRCSIYCAK